jgi:ADP-ribose pyrophosphatase
MTSSPAGPQRWEKLGESLDTRTRIFDLLRARYRHPGREVEREFVILSSPDWVNVLAVTPDEQLVLVRQFRYGIGELSLEIPGGIMEAGEDPVAAGCRELCEETGYTGRSARLLGTVHPNPAFQSNRAHFVLVEGAVKTHDHAWDGDEEIEVTVMPVPETLALARRGGITHSLVLNALMFFEPVFAARKA